MLSSVVMMLLLALYFLKGNLSGVILIIVGRLAVVSFASGAAHVSATGMELTLIKDTGDLSLSKGLQALDLSGLLALEMAVIVTGDLARSKPPKGSQSLLFEAIVIGVFGTIVMRGFWFPRVGMMVVLEKKSSARGLVISKVAVLFR